MSKSGHSFRKDYLPKIYKSSVMKRSQSLTLSFLLLICFGLRAQENGLTMQEQLDDTLIARYNRGDLKGIWQLGNNDWKKKSPFGDFESYLNYLKARSGLIKSSKPSERTGNYLFFQWVGVKKTLIAGLANPSAQTFDDINFNFFISPAELNAVQTDNPLKTVIDSGVNNVATRFMIINSVPGMSIGIFDNGKTYLYNYGTVEQEKNILPTNRTIYDLGSITKSFTGILLAQAVIDKKVNLADDIRKWLNGDYPNLAYESHPIRLVDLADYTSGLSDIPPDTRNMTEVEKRLFAAKYTVAEFLEDFHNVNPDFIPGTKYQYSSSAVELLAAILERIYNMSYANLIQKFIAGPMGMTDTRVTISSETDTLRFAKGYGADGGERHWNYGPTFELGGIHSTARDMLLYIVQNIKETNSAVKLSHKQTTQLGIADEESGLGWFIEPTARGIQIEKGGNSPRHSSECILIREKNIGVICFTNLQGQDLQNLAQDILDQITKK